MSSQTVNLNGTFTGSQAFNTFQNAMFGSVSAVGKFAVAIGGANSATNSFNSNLGIVGGNISVTFGNLSNALSSLQSTIGALNASFKGNINISNAFNNNMLTTGKNLSIVNGLMRTMTEGSNGFLLSWQSIFRLMQSQLLARYIQMIAGSIDQAIISAAEFSVRISAIQTISQEANVTHAQWGHSIRALSDEFGNPLLQVAIGTFDAISNQVVKGTAATRFMAEAMQFARVAIATTAESVNLLSSIINSYGKSSEEAGRLSAGLFSMIELGRVNASEIANSFGPLVVSAKLLGLELNEVYASMAILTSQGTRSSVAITNISNVMQKLIKPSEEMKDLFREWGVTSGEAAIATFGFSGVLERLGREADKGGLTRIGELMKDLRAIRGTAGLVGGNILGSFEEVKSQIDASAEKYENAKKLMTESPGIQFQVELNKIKNILTADLGEASLQFFINFSKGIGSISKLVRDFVTTLFAMGASLATVAGWFINLFQILDKWGIKFGTLIITVATGTLVWRQAAWSIAAFNAAMAMSITTSTALQISVATLSAYLGFLTVGITVVLGVMALWIESEQRAAQASIAAAEERAKAFDEIHKLIMKDILDQNEAEAKQIHLQTSNINMYIATIRKAWDAIILAAVGTRETVEAEAKELNKILVKMARDVKENAIDEIRATMKSSLAMAGGDVAAQVDVVSVAITQLREATEEALAGGNFEFARKLFEEFEKSVADVQDRIDKVINKSIESQKDILRKLEERKFNLSLEMMTPTNAKKAMELRIDELIGKAKAKPTDPESEKFLAEAQKLAEKITDQGKPKTALDREHGFGKIDTTQEDKVAAAKIEVELIRHKSGMMDKMQAASDAALMTSKKLEESLMKQRTEREAQLKAMEGLDLLQRKQLEAQQLLLDLGTKRDNLQAKVTEAVKGSAAVVKEIGGAATSEGWGDDRIHLINLREQEKETRISDISEMMNRFDSGDLSAKKVSDWAFREMGSVREKSDLKAEDVEKIAGAYEDLGLAILEVSKEQKKLSQEETGAEALKKQITELEALLATAKVKWPDIFKDIADKAKKPTEAFIEQLRQSIIDFDNASQVMPGAALKTGPDGRRGFAQGGLIDGPGGFDNLTVKAMAGEHITNNQMTARYYPVLQAINAGTYPTNNSTNNYEMTFNVQGGQTTGQTIRNLGKQLKRAIQRKQIYGLG